MNSRNSKRLGQPILDPGGTVVDCCARVQTVPCNRQKPSQTVMRLFLLCTQSCSAHDADLHLMLICTTPLNPHTGCDAEQVALHKASRVLTCNSCAGPALLQGACAADCCIHNCRHVTAADCCCCRIIKCWQVFEVAILAKDVASDIVEGLLVLLPLLLPHDGLAGGTWL